MHRIYNALTATSILLALLVPGGATKAAESSVPVPTPSTEHVLTDMKPYPWTITKGVICDTADDLKAYIEALEAQVPTPQECMVLGPGTSIDATATPMEVYKSDSAYGMITKYTIPGLPDSYGIMAIRPAPVSSTPAPSASDQHI